MLSIHQNRIFASSINSFSVRQLETAKALRAMEGQLQQDTSVIINALQATSNTVIPKPIICTLESTIKSYVKEGFKESFQELQARLEEQHRTGLEPPLQEMHDVEAESRGFDLSSPNKTDPVPVIQDQSSSLDDGEEMQRSSVQYEQFKNHKAYDTLFGRIGVSIRATLKITKVIGFGVEKDNSERIFNASFTFKPCSWLSRPAVWNLTVQQKSSSIGHNLNIQPTYSPIVSHKSPIFQSCREGDLLKVIEILRTGQASVHDIDEWGRGLMHVSPFRFCAEQCSRLIRHS